MGSHKSVLFLLVAVAMLLVFPLAGAAWTSAPRAAYATDTLEESLAGARAYIDALTINSAVNVPTTVVEDTSLFFSWDNEKRAYPAKPYLYEWSYYNGVVFEGIEYVYQATGEAAYRSYADAYLDAMVTGGALNDYAGYVSTHGLDCYKTASLLRDFANSEYNQVAATLYHDLTVVNAQYAPLDLGYNYWHTWISGQPPAYKVWLDGIYMGQPFMAEQAYLSGDTAQLDKIAARFDWVHDNMVNASTGLYYHAANSSTSYVPYHWLRAIGWYAMAQVDVMPTMSGANLDLMAANFQDFVDGMLPYQDAATGMWTNIVNEAVSDSNRFETSGTAMMSYAILKAVRNGWLDDPAGTYTAVGIKAFEGIVAHKLVGSNLIDNYLKASATGSDNYHIVSYYYSNEGKGVGPFIMAYAEALQADTSGIPTPTPTGTPTPTPTPGPGGGTYQAEVAVISAGCRIESEHDGYFGTGYVNYPSSGEGAYIEYRQVDGGAGGSATLRCRFALATGERTGLLTVNGASQEITFPSTGGWANWVTMDLLAPLNSGTNNTISLSSTGQDLANQDQLEVIVHDLPTGVILGSFEVRPQGRALHVTWETGSEVELNGFNLLRAEGPDGERVQLNAELILAEHAGDPIGAAYEYLDTAVQGGVRYRYWLQVVDVYGSKGEVGPVTGILGPQPAQSVYLPMVLR